jgi:hypothetical protein
MGLPLGCGAQIHCEQGSLDVSVEMERQDLAGTTECGGNSRQSWIRAPLSREAKVAGGFGFPNAIQACLP